MNIHNSFAERENWSKNLPQLSHFQEKYHRKFLSLNWPKRKDEKWRYTNLSTLEKWTFRPPQGALPASEIDNLECLRLLKQGDKFNLIVIENGQVRGDLCQISDSRLKWLRGSQVSTKEIESFTSDDEPFFSVMNGALLPDLSYISVPKGAQINSPLFIVHLSAPDESMEASFHRLLVEVNEGASLSLSEIHLDSNEIENFSNSVALINIKECANLDYLKVQGKNSSSHFYSNVDVSLDKNSNFHCLGINLGGVWARQELRVRHRGEAASSQVKGLYVAQGRSRQETYTSIEHEKAHGSSHQLHKGILSDKSRAVFNGRIFIAPGSQKVDSSQYNKNLLLSPDAEVDTKPELEIYADDVKANHGATVGQINEDEMFYLLSRGISPQTSRYAIIRGFLSDLIMASKVVEFRKLSSLLIEKPLKTLVGNK